MVLEVAARESGVPIADILENLPAELSVWVDPGEVSYRIGEKGAVKVRWPWKAKFSAYRFSRLRHRFCTRSRNTTRPTTTMPIARSPRRSTRRRSASGPSRSSALRSTGWPWVRRVRRTTRRPRHRPAPCTRTTAHRARTEAAAAAAARRLQHSSDASTNRCSSRPRPLHKRNSAAQNWRTTRNAPTGKRKGLPVMIVVYDVNTITCCIHSESSARPAHINWLSDKIRLTTRRRNKTAASSCHMKQSPPRKPYVMSHAPRFIANIKIAPGAVCLIHDPSSIHRHTHAHLSHREILRNRKLLSRRIALIDVIGYNESQLSNSLRFSSFDNESVDVLWAGGRCECRRWLRSCFNWMKNWKGETEDEKLTRYLDGLQDCQTQFTVYSYIFLRNHIASFAVAKNIKKFGKKTQASCTFNKLTIVMLLIF